MGDLDARAPVANSRNERVDRLFQEPFALLADPNHDSLALTLALTRPSERSYSVLDAAVELPRRERLEVDGLEVGRHEGEAPGRVGEDLDEEVVEGGPGEGQEVPAGLRGKGRARSRQSAVLVLTRGRLSGAPRAKCDRPSHCLCSS